jgi:hypothetical protein
MQCDVICAAYPTAVTDEKSKAQLRSYPPLIRVSSGVLVKHNTKMEGPDEQTWEQNKAQTRPKETWCA